LAAQPVELLLVEHLHLAYVLVFDLVEALVYAVQHLANRTESLVVAAVYLGLAALHPLELVVHFLGEEADLNKNKGI
jgi:hypothetical protein